MSQGGIDPRLRALYDSERANAVHVPPGAADRVLAGVNAKLAAGATTVASTTAAVTAGGVAAAAAIAIAIGIFAALEGAGPPAAKQVTGHVAADAAVEATIAREPLAPERGDAAPPELARVPDAPSTSTPPARPRAPRPAPPGIDEEWTLVERARVALRAGRAEAALELLETHAERHPEGALAEERDRLAIEALVTSGRADDARRRAAGFRRHHPGSLHQPEIDHLLRR